MRTDKKTALIAIAGIAVFLATPAILGHLQPAKSDITIELPNKAAAPTSQEFIAKPKVAGNAKGAKFEWASENLPEGLIALDPDTGTIRGRATSEGTFKLRVKATDATGAVAYSNPMELITFRAEIMVPKRIDVPHASVSIRGSIPLYGLENPKVSVVAGTLPEGFAFEVHPAASGGSFLIQMDGNGKSKPGVYEGIVLRADDGHGNVVDSQPFTIAVGI